MSEIRLLGVKMYSMIGIYHIAFQSAILQKITADDGSSPSGEALQKLSCILFDKCGIKLAVINIKLKYYLIFSPSVSMKTNLIHICFNFPLLYNLVVYLIYLIQNLFSACFDLEFITFLRYGLILISYLYHTNITRNFYTSIIYNLN